MNPDKSIMVDRVEEDFALQPTKPTIRNLNFSHFFSLWMGSIHNIPSYVTVGGFFALGLSITEVMVVILASAFLLTILIQLNGHAGNKYGIPFVMFLKTSFGGAGALLPGVLRGIIAGIMWFGLQTYAGSLAITILIGQFWPAYINLGGEWTLFGLSLTHLISFLVFWFINLCFSFGGMKALGKLSNVITPLVFLIFGGMSIWIICQAGGVEPILLHGATNISATNIFTMITCMSALLATWVAPILSVSDYTRYARTTIQQSLGQFLGIMVSYGLFAAASISIIKGTEMLYGKPIWNILDVIGEFDSKLVVCLSLITVCLSTLSVNITGNIIPAINQLISLFPKLINSKSAAIIISIAGMVIMPWKLMENSTSIFTFLNMVGGLLSPVIGIMITQYFLIDKKKIDIKELYHNKGDHYYSSGVNKSAILAMCMAGGLSLSGHFISSLEPLYNLSFFVGIISSILLYLLFIFMNTVFFGKFGSRQNKESS
ncbi:cytosine permease [Cytobacillus sp. FSL W7-1323]|uniref:cytosine permease n=1 Tax=Cytobacillus sp. FSL W7-1323 TaxID=2921700 RepID=UPI0031587C3E